MSFSVLIPSAHAFQQGEYTNGQIRTCYSRPSGTNSVGTFQAGTQVCANEMCVACQNEILPTEEICDGKDKTCDRRTDDITTVVNDCGSYLEKIVDGVKIWEKEKGHALSPDIPKNKYYSAAKL